MHASVMNSSGEVLVRTSAGRELLIGQRTYYVSPSGNDANDGLSSLTPFLTIQRAVDVVANTLDCAQHQVIIQLANGTYAPFTTRVVVGSIPRPTPQVMIIGNTSDPSTVVIETTGANQACITHNSPGVTWEFSGLTLSGPHSGAGGLYCRNEAHARLGVVRFSSVSAHHVYAAIQGTVLFSGNVTIAGGGTTHLYSDYGGTILSFSRSHTLSGTPAFTAFAIASRGTIVVSGTTYSGGATGQRYQAIVLGAIYGDGDANKFPGSVAGTPAPGVLGTSGGYYA